MTSVLRNSVNSVLALYFLHPENKKAGRKSDPPQKSQVKIYSNFSVINGNCNFAFASDFTTKPSADSDVVLRAVAISLTNKYLARSSIFFSRKESGLLLLRETKLLRTTATSPFPGSPAPYLRR